MANYRGHIGGALAVCVVYVGAATLLPVAWAEKTGYILADWQMVAALFIIAMLFGLWPDIDTNSRAQDIFFGVAFLCDIALLATGRIEAAAYLGLLAMTPIVGKHRGWTHSKVAMILVPLPILILPYFYDEKYIIPAALFYGAALSGYFSHLLLDGLIWSKIRIKGGW
jgi:membrane-bound metal-dependent hydrolase YbcI (DUF457 family)